MTCKHCGYINDGNSGFCAMCGAQLSENTAPQPQQQPAYSYEDYSINEQDFNQQPAYAPQQPYAQQPYAQQPYYAPPVEPQNPGKGLGIASLVLGIVSFLCCNPLYLFSIIAIICGAIGRKKSKEVDMKNGTATAGLVLGILPIAISVVITVVYIVIAVIMIATMGFDEFMWTMEEFIEEFIYVFEDILYEFGLY